MATESLSEQVAELERERDHLKANQGVDPEFMRAYEREKKRRIAAESALAQARVEGAREARRQAHSLCREMMICASPQGTDEAPYDAWIRAKFPEFYPATGEEPTRGEEPTHEPDHGRTGNPAQWCERCRVEASRPAPQAVPEPPRAVPPKVVAAFIAPINSSRWQGGLVNVTEDGAWWGYADAAGEWQRIVGPLASRPTASGEG